MSPKNSLVLFIGLSTFCISLPKTYCLDQLPFSSSKCTRTNPLVRYTRIFKNTPHPVFLQQTLLAAYRRGGQHSHLASSRHPSTLLSVPIVKLYGLNRVHIICLLANPIREDVTRINADMLSAKQAVIGTLEPQPMQRSMILLYSVTVLLQNFG
ncbi:hypothetical protein CI102_15033 [Trichoderma harzianum]|uniref:Uncharacterized protein n=1 Tax=Trichoderma harzianum CBS 226.95 TaxID=983964 RepID=A0A2T4A5V8_TRIHA|nr:hypothetical protein M431DRAFT_217624 [Trichoderma harzianum CBS 226.95]PKK42942.1 hypothetical protein CI102_15033 [Trichoderma harzianum]PTB52434.1 hypothetical protein M431DRAFT_217624 [Trichoderma harzianum CBS 226.95]